MYIEIIHISNLFYRAASRCFRGHFASCQSTRGQAHEYGSRPSLESDSWQLIFVSGSCSFQLHQMARVKNARGDPGDEDPRPPPRQPTDAKGKAMKKLATMKRKYPDVDTVRVATVAEAAERVERGGAQSGVVIADQLSSSTRAALEQVERCHGGPAGTVMVGGWRVAIDETQSQGEPQQQA